MPAVAMTDHGNLFGAVEFYISGGEEGGVKPIIGCEVYLAPGAKIGKGRSAGPKEFKPPDTAGLEREGATRTWSSSVSRAHLDGFYYKPRTDRAGAGGVSTKV